MTSSHACHFERAERVRNPTNWAEKYLDCVNVGVPVCEKPLIDWALARKISCLSSYLFS
jgi:hypothetical protein